jgi:hypothetical protein
MKVTKDGFAEYLSHAGFRDKQIICNVVMYAAIKRMIDTNGVYDNETICRFFDGMDEMYKTVCVNSINKMIESEGENENRKD